MAQVNPCLRCLFIAVNIFFMIVGGLTLVFLALLPPSLADLQGGSDSGSWATSHIILYIGGPVAMVIAILGAYGAYRENLLDLCVFLVCMFIGSLLMLGAGSAAAFARPQLKSLMEERWRWFLPLDKASDNIRNQAEALQTSLHCCGLFSHEDWEENIPDSCLCSFGEEVEGKCQTVSRGNFLLDLFRQRRSVFRQSCFPLIMESVTLNTDVTLGLVCTLLVLALLGLVLSSLMIYQMCDASNSPNTPLFVPVMFSDQPPSYQQLYNLPE